MELLKCNGLHLIIFLLSVCHFTDSAFDCRRRRNSGCKNGGTCSLTVSGAVCSCPAAYSGYDCSVTIANRQADLTPCSSIPCSSDGTLACEVDGVDINCICKVDFYGNDCSINRVYADCSDPSGIQIVMNPYITSGQHSDFNGKIYVENKEGDASCAFDPSNLPTSQMFQGSATNVLDFISTYDCFDPLTGNQYDSATSTSIVELKVVVQYELYRTSLDDIYTIQCLHPSSGPSSQVSSSSPITSLNRQDGGLNSAQLQSSIELSTTDEFGIPLIGSVAVGITVKLKLELLNTSAYSDYFVQSCTAQNLPPSTSYPPGSLLSVSLVSSGCADPAAVDVNFKNPLSKTLQVTELTLRAFRFDTANVWFLCELILCKPTSNVCDPITCRSGLGGTVSDQGYGRKRRQTLSKDHSEHAPYAASTLITVTDISHFIKGPYSDDTSVTQYTRTDLTMKRCMGSFIFYAVVIVFVTLFTLVAIAMILVYKCKS
ncbi:unnamed protein product [Owenia fusiformis]|uniref:Uncharacterized protein n=1 Tax=Owenia fusiformis TaxID=6347 RepID=A0A8J1Y3Q6_OWEFU|nr:unnamed protein product [Owenia fusiformis]